MFTNYKYYTDNKSIVIAASTYAGKTVRGIAKCDPRDKFNLDDGKALAAARCDLKIAKKRKERAMKKYVAVCKKLKYIADEFENVCDYYKNSSKAVRDAQSYLDKISSHY